jgi:hypothetical protein
MFYLGLFFGHHQRDSSDAHPPPPPAHCPTRFRAAEVNPLLYLAKGVSHTFVNDNPYYPLDFFTTDGSSMYALLDDGFTGVISRTATFTPIALIDASSVLRYKCFLCGEGSQSNQVVTFRGEAYYDPTDLDSDSDVFHTGSGTYRFDVDIPECPTKPYRSFFVAVERTVAPPPPPLPAPPPPYFNAIDVTFSVVFEGVRFSDYQGSLEEIQERLLLILVTNTAAER